MLLVILQLFLLILGTILLLYLIRQYHFLSSAVILNIVMGVI